MIKEIDEITEFKKRVKKASKANLFTPIFFSLVFAGVILGTTSDTELELWKVILEIGLAALLSLVFWLNFLGEKKNEKHMNAVLDDFARNPDSENEINDQMTDQEMEMTNSKVMAFFTTQVFVVAGNGLFAFILVPISRIVDFPTWVLILTVVLWVVFFLISGSILIAKHKALTSFLNSLKEE